METFNISETGKSIADMGFLVMAAAAYIVFSSALFFFFVKWFMRIVNGIIERQQHILEEILSLQKQQHSLLNEINGEIKRA